MKKLPIFLSLAAALTTLASCEKEPVELQAPAQNQAIKASTQPGTLAGGTWHLTDMISSTVTAGNNQASSVSMFARLKPSVVDNQFKYQEGGQYVEDEGALKSHADAPQQFTGAWHLNAKGDSLILQQGQTVRRYGIAELTATTLRLRSTMSYGGNTQTTLTTVYSR